MSVKKTTMKKTNILLFIALIATLTLTGCAHSYKTQVIIQESEHIYGFWGGTWHGMISAFSFIGSLSNDDIKVYASNNNGHWYDFGFVGGLFFMIRMFIRLIKKPNSN
jgi:hypothetical protein